MVLFYTIGILLGYGVIRKTRFYKDLTAKGADFIDSFFYTGKNIDDVTVIKMPDEVRLNKKIDPELINEGLPLFKETEFYKDGMKYYEAKDFTRAISYFEDELHYRPVNINARIKLVFSCRSTGQLDKAIEHCKIAIKQNSSIENIYTLLGDMYLEKEWYEEAINALQKELDRNPNKINTKIKLARALRERGKIEEAEAECNSILSLEKNNLEALILRSAIYIEKGELEGATGDLNYIREVNQSKQIKHFTSLTLATIYIDVKQYDRALSESLEADKIMPEDKNSMILYSHSCIGLEEYEKAKSVLLKINDKMKENPAYHYCLGYSNLGLGLIEDSINNFQEAEKLNPELSEPYHGLALAYKLKGLSGQAAKNYDKAQELKPKGKNFIELKKVTYEVLPDKYGDYQVITPNYAGGRTTFLHIAKNMNNGEKVLIKELNNTFACQSEYIKMFKKEVEFLKDLDNPHIVKILFDGTNIMNNRYFFVMEYMEGGSLSDRINRTGLFDERDIIKISLEICEGLKYIHNLKLYGKEKSHLVHRAINPNNILFDKEDRVKISDFGQAKVTATFVSTMKRSTGSLKLKPYYSSPELCKGLKVDTRADLYSLGSIMYEMATGKPVYYQSESDSEFDIIKRILKKDFQPEPPSEMNPGLSSLMNDIILKAISKNIEDRFQKVEEFMGELNKLIIKE